jgi:hypothetical protein
LLDPGGQCGEVVAALEPAVGGAGGEEESVEVVDVVGAAELVVDVLAVVDGALGGDVLVG